MRRSLFLVSAMVAAVACVGALAWWDGARESAEALEDFGANQAALATSIATGLSSGMPLEPFARFDRPGESMVLIAAQKLTTLDSREVISPALLEAFRSGASTFRLSRAEAAALGLPQRTAIAGIGHHGGFGVIVVTSALRERDRERRAGTRLLLSVLLAALIVGAFGGWAMREQRREWLLAEDARLQRLSRAATMLTMASGIAHEIATPLGVIVGRAEQLQARVAGDERAERAVQAILDQAAHVDTVMRGFLDLARGGAPALQRVAPSVVSAAAIRLVEHRFAQKRVSLDSRVADDLPAIPCEPRLLEHALTNLLLNACEACAPGGHVELSAEVQDGSLRFVVLDDGAGITIEEAARAAEPFYTTKQTGTGLGLAIASEIAKTHRGSLRIEPSHPTGTRACVQLPLSPSEAADA